MKKQIAILAALVAATSFSAFGQGFLTFSTANNSIWDEFTTPGSGVRANADVTVAFLWAPTTATDSLTSVQGTNSPGGGGLGFGLRAGAPSTRWLLTECLQYRGPRGPLFRPCSGTDGTSLRIIVLYCLYNLILALGEIYLVVSWAYLA